MVVVGIIALLTAILVPNVLRSRITANETAAQATLHTIATALETYAAANGVTYADDEALLTGANPKYLSRSYCGTSENGYAYGCTLATGGYTLTARPLDCVRSGTKSFTMTTGSYMVTDASCTAAGG
jgi:type II secretory pathway pseudopilin PulG